MWYDIGEYETINLEYVTRMYIDMQNVYFAIGSRCISKYFDSTDLARAEYNRLKRILSNPGFRSIEGELE